MLSHCSYLNQTCTLRCLASRFQIQRIRLLIRPFSRNPPYRTVYRFWKRLFHFLKRKRKRLSPWELRSKGQGSMRLRWTLSNKTSVAEYGRNLVYVLIIPVLPESDAILPLMSLQLPEYYNEILNHFNASDELRRETESKLFHHKQRYLYSLSPSGDSAQTKVKLADELDELVDGIILLRIPNESVWTFYLEGQDCQSICKLKDVCILDQLP